MRRRYDFDVVGKDESLGDAFFLVSELINQKGPVRKALRMNSSNGQKLPTILNIDVELMSVEKVRSALCVVGGCFCFVFWSQAGVMRTTRRPGHLDEATRSVRI